MKNLYDGAVKAEVLERLSLLTADTPRLWGTMDVAQMMAHCSTQLQMGLGEVKSNLMYNSVVRWLAKETFGLRLSWSKNLPTAREMVKTDPCRFGQERVNLIATINRFYEAHEWHPHPIFGNMNKTEWGIVAYKHLNHHLRQFGV